MVFLRLFIKLQKQKEKDNFQEYGEIGSSQSRYGANRTLPGESVLLILELHIEPICMSTGSV